MRLFAERGYDATTLAQIGEEAEVAPRTVSMYFPSKLHLALAFATASATRLERSLTERTGRTSAVDVVVEWLRRESVEHGEEMAVQAAMLRANPEIRGAETAELIEAKRAITAALATDLGRADDDEVVAIVGGAFAGIIDVVVRLGPEEADAMSAVDAAATMLQAVMRAARPMVGAT